MTVDTGHLLPLTVRAETRPRSLTLEEAIEESRADRAWRARFVQGTLALDARPDPDLPRPGAGRVPLPEPAPFAARVGLAVLEVMVGTRGPAQLVRCTTPEVHAVVARQGALARRRMLAGPAGSATRPRIQVRRVLVSEPSEGIAEATLVILDGSRVRAVAMRLNGREGVWRVDALQVG